MKTVVKVINHPQPTSPWVIKCKEIVTKTLVWVGTLAGVGFALVAIFVVLVIMAIIASIGFMF